MWAIFNSYVSLPKGNNNDSELSLAMVDSLVIFVISHHPFLPEERMKKIVIISLGRGYTRYHTFIDLY